MKAYQAGDEQAFHSLYDRHSRRVYGYLRKKMRRPEEVDEVFQAVFVKLHKSRSGFDPSLAFTAWLFVLVKSVLLDHWRKTLPANQMQSSLSLEEVISSDPSDNAEAAMTSNEMPEGMAHALQVLPDDQRQIVQLRVLDELSYEEISKRIAKSPANVRKILSRALKQMRNHLGGSTDSTRPSRRS